jgi:hypothetical protein
MNQPYLDIARSYINGTAALPITTEPPPAPPHEPRGDAGEPTPLAAYRIDGTVRRCSNCGRLLSVIAVSDLCGRCVGPQLQTAPDTEWSEEVVLRGKALVALDRRGYPRLRLPNGSHAGPGLVSWAPVLRESNFEELSALLETVRRMQTPARRQTEEDADALP